MEFSEMSNLELIKATKDSYVISDIFFNLDDENTKDLIVEVFDRFEKVTVRNIENSKKYHTMHKEKHNEQKRKYYQEHKEEINRKRRKEYKGIE